MSGRRDGWSGWSPEYERAWAKLEEKPPVCGCQACVEAGRPCRRRVPATGWICLDCSTGHVGDAIREQQPQE